MKHEWFDCNGVHMQTALCVPLNLSFEHRDAHAQ
jgi:hypothetical protein